MDSSADSRSRHLCSCSGVRPKLLIIGPDRAGNLLEVIMLSLAADQILAIHAMPLRRHYYELLPGGGHDDG